MILPSLLRPGETVGVIAPSGPVDRERLLDGISYLQRRGYEVREGDSLYARTRYLAGRDADRAADLNQMLGDREVRAIFTARGGYGSARLLDLVDYDLVREDPKIFVGFSDTTALQLGLYARTGLVSYSGVVLCKDVNPAGMVGPTEERLWDALTKGRFSPLEGLQTLRAGRVGGPLLGGCLSLVVSLAGTPYLPALEGAVLFLEDVNEPPYRLDRLLFQLRMAGIFDRVGGVVFGQFEGCDPEAKEEGTPMEVFTAFAESVSCPVYAGLPYGHGQGRTVLPVGIPVIVEEAGRMTFDANTSS